MEFELLTTEQEAEFRKWARDNYEVFDSINGLWHPVVQEECVKMNIERSKYERKEANGV